MVALLAFIPARRKNLAALEVGRHVIQQGDRWFIIIPREETKTGTPIEFLIPELLVSYLTVYLDVVRPQILRGALCAALWVRPIRNGALSEVGLKKVSIGSRFTLASASPLMTHGLQRPQPGLFPRPIRSALPATCLLIAICASPRGTTIARVGSKPVGHTVR
jgi:hypothetical protein